MADRFPAFLSASSIKDKGFDEDGPKIGSAHLLAKTGAGYAVRPHEELASILLGRTFDQERSVSGLAAVARALNKGDIALADDLNDAIQLLVHGAKALHVGYYLDHRDLEKKALKTIRRAIDSIDAISPCGRDVLLPLLDHRDEGVRVVAAAGVWQSHPDLAIPLLEKIELCSITEAGPLAMTVLLFDGRKNPCGSDPRFPSLYEDENGVYRWHEEAFQSEMLERGLRRDEIARARRRT